MKSMYSSGRIIAFDEFRLRKVIELDALKLFFLFVARRDQKTNLANIGTLWLSGPKRTSGDSDRE